MKTIHQIRHDNLRTLYKQVGCNNSKLAHFLGRDRQETYLYTKQSPRNIGDSFARLLETKFNKPPGWMDVAHSLRSPELLATLNFIQDHLWEYYEVASPEEQMELLDAVYEQISELEKGGKQAHIQFMNQMENM